MKYIFPAFLAVILFAAVLNSCSPTPTGIEPTSLIHLKNVFPATRANTVLRSFADTNSYNFSLSCGCGFELKVEGADTSSILYNVGNIATQATSHIIKAYPKSGLAKGTYYGWLAVVTLKPDTNEDFRDTLRDTVMIP